MRGGERTRAGRKSPKSRPRVKDFGVETRLRDVYDVEDPDTYGTMMNRLMRTEARVGGVLTETTDYEYTEEGNVGRIVRRVPGVTTVTATQFEYDRPGHARRTVGFAREADVGA